MEENKVKIKHCPRENNSAAHNLVQYGMMENKLTTFADEKSLPPYVKGCMTTDKTTAVLRQK